MGSRNDTMASLIIIPFASPAPVFARLPYPVGAGDGRGGSGSRGHYPEDCADQS